MMADALAALEPVPGETVLDLGVGGGWLSARLLARGCALVGVDPSAEVVARTRRRLPAGRFLEGRAEALPLADAALDGAASVNTIYFWPVLEPPVAELARVLKPGGRLVLGFQTAEAVRAWPGHVHGFTAWETADVEAALDAGGFRVVAVQAGRNWRVRDYCTLVALRAG
jgi:SAM-dependent methyltransferase